MFTTQPIRVTIAAFTCCLLTGCASVWHPQTPQDPYESYNRAVFKFNLSVDRHIFRPTAQAYKQITPVFVQNGIKNFFGNIDQIPTIGNDLLQANGSWAAADVGRLLVNTTLGVGGLFDVAARIGLKKHDQDFGLTMAKWGVKESPYFIFPFLGPTTTRDFFASGVDYYGLSVWPYVDPSWLRYSARGVDFIQYRAQFLATDKWVDQAFDPYIFVRDFYLQNRNAKIQKVLHPEKNEPSLDEAEPAAPANTPTVGAGAAK